MREMSEAAANTDSSEAASSGGDRATSRYTVCA